MACRISGTVSAPIDLSTLVATSFIDYKVLEFKLNDTCLHGLVGSNAKALSADEIIRTLKNKFRSLNAEILRSPSEANKLDM